MIKEIILATKNPDKTKEIKKLLSIRGIKLKILPRSYKAPCEDGKTISQNARVKASTAAKKFNSWSIADDTGLEINYLKDAPGVFSARFAGQGCSYLDNVKKVLGLMKGVLWEKRKAVFKTAVCLCSPSGKKYCLEGKCSGYITTKSRGNNGFGYDPIFYEPKSGKTFAEMNMAEKNRVSHRSRAFRKAAKLIKKFKS